MGRAEFARQELGIMPADFWDMTPYEFDVAMAIWDEKNRLQTWKMAAHEMTLAAIFGFSKKGGVPLLITDFLPEGFMPPIVISDEAKKQMMLTDRALSGRLKPEDVPAWARGPVKPSRVAKKVTKK